MLLIFVQKSTPRKEYICKHIFKRLLYVDFQFTHDLSTFIAHQGPKLTYANKPLGDEFFIFSEGLLDQNGIDYFDIDLFKWRGLPAFFKSKVPCEVPFDLFSAAFYLITRYEEYLPQVKDALGRYSPLESLAFKNEFLHLPLIDLWVGELDQLLSQRFGNAWKDLKTKPASSSKIHLLFEVKSAFKFRFRGSIENLRMILRYTQQLKVKELFRWVATQLRWFKDPYDVYDHLIKWVVVHKKSVNASFFFHLGDYSAINNGISHRYRKYQEFIKHIGDYVGIGLRFTIGDQIDSQELEKKRFERITNRPLEKTMVGYSKIAMPAHYKSLIEYKEVEDYSMGYPSQPGYRASTAHPFYFYDLDYEVQTPLKVVPYALHYGSISGFMLTSQQELVKTYKNQSQEVAASFIMMFSIEQLDRTQKGHSFRILKELIHG
jgi:hypothetical protein